MTDILGKGMFLWIINRVEGGDPEAIADAAANAGLTHVLIKAVNGVNKYNITNGVDLVPPTTAALKARGIDVWIWQYTYAYSPIQEAQAGANRVNEIQPTGFVVNAEKEYKGQQAAALQYMSTLMPLVDVPVYLSTYRYPILHPSFPWAEFGQYVDGYMPQVYWVGAYNPAWQLHRCLFEYGNLPYPNKPIIPTGCAYPSGTWSPTPEQEVEFLNAAKNVEGLTGANFWEWKYARYTIPSLWAAISDYEWGEPVPPPPPGEGQVRTKTSLNVRTRPMVDPSTLIGAVPQGTIFDTAGMDGDWVKVITYVHGDYVEWI